MEDAFKVWINHDIKRVSFHEISGYLEKTYQSRDEMFENIFKLLNKGYLVI